MLRDLIARLLDETVRLLVAEGRLPTVAAEYAPEVQDPRNPEHGDFATNWAMVASKPTGTAPRTLAETLVARLKERSEFAHVEVAGPGFINLKLAPTAPGGLLLRVLELGPEHLARELPVDHLKRINIEFVSVNPNGPITIGSGRGAAFGSALANVLAAAGHEVWREYYINDGVNSEQMRVFSESVRSLATGLPFPEKGYRGDYVQAVADTLVQMLETGVQPQIDYSEKFAEDETMPGTTRTTFRRYARAYRWFADAKLEPKAALAAAPVEAIQTLCEGLMIQAQRDALDKFGVTFDVWFSEQSLHDTAVVEGDIAELEAKAVADEEPVRTKLKLGRGGKVEEVMREEQPNDEDDVEGAGKTLWLRSTRFGDDMDRVLRRRDGRLTYIASDVSYHRNKFERPTNSDGAGADKLITILGPDHHGYIGRLRAVVAAMLLEPEMTDEEALAIASARLEVVIYQLVRFLKDGQPAPMRKRDGNIYALADLLAEIGRKVKPDAGEFEQIAAGKDVARFFYLMRSHDSTFDFDLDLAERQSDENPVFYVQYAHARIQSVLRKAEESGHLMTSYDEDALAHPKEIALLKQILDLPNEVRRAAEDYGVHRLTTYAIELARAYHGFYDSCRVLQPDEPRLTSARLDLCRATAIALQGALALLGVDAPDRMDRPAIAAAE